MQWLELTIQTSSTGINRVADRLTALGYDSFVLDDGTEVQALLEQNRMYWGCVDESLVRQTAGRSQIRLYLERDHRAQTRLEALRESLSIWRRQQQDIEVGPLTITAAPLQEEDWENSWKQNYPPQFVGERLAILPYWAPLETAEDRLPIILDPGLTFGTGAHPSTQLCLTALEEHLTPGALVADLGCGSGILSIAALRLGAEIAFGVDLDPKSEDISRENARYNGFGDDRFRAMTGDLCQDERLWRYLTAQTGGFDLVLVNIVSDVICALAPMLPTILRSNGVVICSGILQSRLPDVEAALTAGGLQVLQRLQQEEWRCLVVGAQPG